MTDFGLPEKRPALMGILNVTPDSFSDGGRHFGQSEAVDWGLKLFDEGADLVDVGGESTRPGAEPVPEEEELRRVIPVVRALARRGIPVSIDTMKPQVARAALSEGAFLVNDVSGLRSEEMVHVCAEAKCHVCIMHMLGEPRTMQANPVYADVVAEVSRYLECQAESAQNNGIPADRIWIDPGFGFGKTVAHNLELVRRFDELPRLGYPVLAGVSRKSFIGKVLGAEESPLPVEERLSGTLAVQAVLQMKGARVIRAHDVKESRQAIELVAMIR